MIRKWIRKLFHKIYITGRHLDQEYIYQSYRDKYQIHPSFRFNGDHILFYGDGKIVAAENSYIGELSTVQAYGNCIISIGKGCCISHNVRMYTQSSDADQDFSVLPLQNKTGDISIGNYVWIGSNVFINPGITIGDNSVIGANSVVAKDIEPNSIVGGVPARLIRYKKKITDVS